MKKYVQTDEAEIRELLTIHAEAEIVRQLSEMERVTLFITS